MKIIRDTIHGNIELNPLELSILDTSEMQRLRYVKQLALAYFVYPSALHTRFEHSLGTFHLTKQLSQRLLGDKADVQLLSLSALLHDVGHSAFSHLTEELVKAHLHKNHEQLGEQKILKGEIASNLEKAGISPHSLLKTIRSNKFKIVSSELGTDRIDYLLRDAYFTGVAYSLVDAQRLLLSLGFKKDQLILQEGGMLAAESLLVSRYLMFNAVYNHHAVRIAGEMLEKSLRIALRNGKIHINDISEGSDSDILFRLRGEPLIGRILRRDLYKIAFEKPGFSPKEKEKRKFKEELEGALSSQLQYSEFAVCMPQPSLGQIEMHVLRDDGTRYDFASSSLIAKAVGQQRKASGLIVATDKKNIGAARKVCEKLI